MKQTMLAGVAFLLLTFLSACVPVFQESSPGAMTPTVVWELIDPVASATPTFESAKTAVAPTTTPTATSAPVDDSTLSPVNQDSVSQEPTVYTHDATNVRQGPGLAYEVSHVLGAGTTTPILGRNQAGDWWAVPGPGDGPGPVGWIFGGVVSVQGNVNSVPILPAPPLTPELPIMGNSGSPVADGCTVAHPGSGDTGPLYVYAGPDEHVFAAVAQLGLDRWVTVIGRDNDWYHVQDTGGVTGWVPVTAVAHNGLCQPDDGPGSIPIIEDPGLPPTNVCIATRPGQFPPPDIHLGPGRQFALVARLGNWAEVVKTEAGWHQILLGPGEVGWINDDDVNLTGSCALPDPAPERIQFDSGETSITLDGNLEPPQREFYVFRAFAGQRVIIEMVSESNRGNFAVSGVEDGQPYKRLEDEQPSWNVVLPTTQDYLLTVAAPADAPTTGYRFTLTIEPLEE